MPSAGVRRVSPGLMSRPSLSRGSEGAEAGPTSACVAGADVPAFVERAATSSVRLPLHTSVAGADVPAFVERCSPIPLSNRFSRVSPGLMSRPSLSADGQLPREADHPGVAGADVPAFVERSETNGNAWKMPRCRRG